MTEIPAPESSQTEAVVTGTAAGATAQGDAPVTTTPDSPAEQQSPRGPRAGEFVIAGFLLVFFVGSYLLSKEWPFRAALFPQMVSIAGGVLAALKVAGLCLAAVRGRRAGTGLGIVPSTRAGDLPEQPMNSSPESQNVLTAAVAAEQQGAAGADAESPSGLTIVDDEQEDDQSLEYVFATAGGRAWAAALGWIGLFFVCFFVLGAYVTVPVFALVYLRFAGRASWLGAAIYAVVTGVIIFVVFRDVVFIPLPESVFPFLQFG